MALAKVLGVLAGGDFDPIAMRRWFDSADIILAADGGANSLATLGFSADETIGDLDSIDPALVSTVPCLRHDQDQDTSDCDKLLSLAQAHGHAQITLIGVEGDRLDHVLGTLYSALRSSLQVRMVLRQGIATLLRGPFEGYFEANVGDRVSLVPLLPCEGVSFEGVQWSLSNASLTPTGLVSLSNRAEASQVAVKIQSGAAVYFSAPREEPIW